MLLFVDARTPHFLLLHVYPDDTVSQDGGSAVPLFVRGSRCSRDSPQSLLHTQFVCVQHTHV